MKKVTAVDSTAKPASEEEKGAATLSETFGFVFRCGRKGPILLFTGTMGGIAHGLAMPMVAYYLSRTFETISKVSGDAQEGTVQTARGMDEIREISFTFMILGVYSLVAAFIESASLELMAFHATRLFQLEWFEALLRQDAAYFDIHSSATTAPTSIIRYRQGLGQRFGQLIQNVVTGLAGVALGLYSSWRVSLLVFAVLPLMSFVTLKSIRMNQGKAQRANECYLEANSTAYSTLSSLRTVLSLNALPHFIQQYQIATQHALENATSNLLQLGFLGGASISSIIVLFIAVILFGSFVLYRDLRDTGCNPAGGTDYDCNNTGADIFAAMMGILFAGQSLSQVGSCLEGLMGARVAAKEALRVIQRVEGTPAKSFSKKEPATTTKSSELSSRADESFLSVADDTPSAVSAVLPKYEINPFSDKGIVRDNILGKIEFKDVTFSYPTRPSVNVLKNFSMTIPAGKTVALVGPSGGGKSTVLSLIERFYDPVEGQVFLDGMDIKDFNLHHYRNALGYVGQEPSLFATTIRENIAYGAENVTQEQIETAAKMANAHNDFILSLPDGYDTHVGDKGAALSGGQKQRIAIARVLVREPKILCLDEATSALDAESELYVQQAIDNILEQRSMTAVIVAHRLSTIRNADLIYVISGGGVVESGTHEELMESESGHYRQLVEKQEGKDATASSTAPDLPTMESQEPSEFFPPPETDAPKRPENQRPILEFRNVQFSYPSRPNRKVLKDFNLSVIPGETLALVGPSGGGKSTTVGLIERFYDPTAGAVLYNGHDIRSLHPAWYRDQIGYVGQEPTLFPGTIAENIALGAPDVTQAMIEEAAKQANIHDFVMTTPDKYNTQVGESGKQLSGGQKQRVAIARALIKRPPILLLDEATSALDNDSEAIVQQALDKLMQSHEHTVIVIAHKLSTIRHCADRIAVVGGGEVLEIGSHDELVAKHGGYYKRLLEAQKRRASLHSLALPSKLTSTVEEDSSEKDEGSTLGNDSGTGSNDEAVAKERLQSMSQRVKQLAKPDIAYVVIGAFGAMLAGATYPLLGLLFAETINVFFFQVPPCDSAATDSCEDYWQDKADEMQDISFEVASYYGMLIASSTLGFSILYWGFGKASERLSKRLRDSVFNALVRQEIGYFDVRNVGDINSKLQENTARLHAFSGTPLRQFTLAMSSVAVGLLLSFIFVWPYALMCILCMVPLAYSGRLREQKKLGMDHGTKESDSSVSSGAIMVEALLNIKTVAALGLERHQLRAFDAAIEKMQLEINRSSAIAGVMSGVGDFIQRWSNALLYFWGGWLLLHYPEQFDFHSFLVSQFTFIFSTLGLAAAMQDISDKAEVEASARWIFSVLDRESSIDPLSEAGAKFDKEGKMVGQLVPPQIEKTCNVEQALIVDEIWC